MTTGVPDDEEGLPPWAIVVPLRRAHIERVAALMRHWTVALRLSPAETRRWLKAAWLHDALRDAPEGEMRRWAPAVEGPVELRHGPAAAARAELEGERDADILSAVRWHSVGWSGWGAIGRALYCADYLEPGRAFDQPGRAALALAFPDDPTAALRTVVTQRLAYAERMGWTLPPESIAFRTAVTE
ncbi:MAG TPA: HD domain-containing protein [Gemmatimonadales bacterium]|jgi:2-amino-4-hydroxy-6-hydroxymethyldihydropteridine diphosphokinase|nr:HD domain-containing protein [Gemmatimonadales bacterium]